MRIICFISLLTLLGYGCEKNTNENAPQVQQATLSVKEIPVEKVLGLAKVDQLRIRELPSLQSRVLVELAENDTLYYLNESTVSTLTIEMRGEQMTSPWLKVETAKGTIGWTYGGGVRLN
ncbi:MAG: SH3 domain-containing protein [Bacteroidota bacterium]